MSEHDTSVLVLDKDVQAVCEFMLANMTAAKLVSVANAVAQLAPVLWGYYPQEEIRALSWKWPSISIAETRSTASESALERSHVGGDFVEETI